MKLAWLTDIHLNFLEVEARQKYYENILVTGCDAILISGDIAEATSLINILKEMVGQIKKPIYFIVGNHDYYRGNINDVRKALTELSTANANLFWLPASGLQQLPNNTVLLGQDGWADGRLGDYQNSPVSLNDSRMIADLFQEKMLGRQHLLQKMQGLADQDANALKNDLTQAVKQQPTKIIILTHVPPFKEVSQHMGQISDDNYLPYFSSKAIGDILMPFAIENPLIDFLVLCGHTHSGAEYQPRTNLIVKAGKAEYYKPGIQEIITI
ncbi:phosphoesterase [Legionella busanensis]|uniref:Phosphoesterase n=1 Tax=Legionella busanensis TaxID=190655 RepID=A0A378JI71_9GAMM|nr:metallophosphoesterase [Legionella busanensis]STX50461.1 phosphoesterase [Legionella busanensis]